MNGKALALDLDLPAAGGPFPVIVWIRGGAWAEGDKAGGPVCAVRLCGGPGELPAQRSGGVPAQLFDVKGAVRWLRANATVAVDAFLARTLKR